MESSATEVQLHLAAVSLDNEALGLIEHRWHCHPLAFLDAAQSSPSTWLSTVTESGSDGTTFSLQPDARLRLAAVGRRDAVEGSALRCGV